MNNQNHILIILKYVSTTIFCLVLVSTVFAQNQSVAQKVYEKYQAFLEREDIKELLPLVFEEIKKPENQELLIPATINLIVDNPDLLKSFISHIDDRFITLLKEDQEIQAFLRDDDVQTLLQDPVAIGELERLLEESMLTLAEKIYKRYTNFFQREDILRILPGVLFEIKKPDTQELLLPATIKLIVEDPDLLKTYVEDIDDQFITLLKEDTETIAVLMDPDVQLLLQNPDAIDELATILDIELVMNIKVRITPASIESPQVGEQLVITVDIADGVNVSGYEGVIQFDATALRFLSLEHGHYLMGSVFPVPTNVENGQISFAQVSTDSIATDQNGTLVTIIFDVIEAKASELIFTEVIIAALGGIPLPVIIEHGEILEPPNAPWDTNNDGRVNILDLTFVASYFGQENTPPAADVNSDGKVNILDLTLVASHFGETT